MSKCEMRRSGRVPVTVRELGRVGREGPVVGKGLMHGWMSNDTESVVVNMTTPWVAMVTIVFSYYSKHLSLVCMCWLCKSNLFYLNTGVSTSLQPPSVFTAQLHPPFFLSLLCLHYPAFPALSFSSGLTSPAGTLLFFFPALFFVSCLLSSSTSPHLLPLPVKRTHKCFRGECCWSSELTENVCGWVRT